MAFLLSRIDEVGVTDFSDLRASYAKFIEARDEYWEDLSQKVTIIVDGFYDYISPEERYYYGADKRKKPYVEAGTYLLGQFSPTSIDELPRENGKLEFALTVTIDAGPESFPKDRVILEMMIERKHGKYHVIAKHNDGGCGFQYSGNLNSASQKHLYELMAVEILSALDPSRFE